MPAERKFAQDFQKSSAKVLFRGFYEDGDTLYHWQGIEGWVFRFQCLPALPLHRKGNRDIARNPHAFLKCHQQKSPKVHP